MAYHYDGSKMLSKLQFHTWSLMHNIKEKKPQTLVFIQNPHWICIKIPYVYTVKINHLYFVLFLKHRLVDGILLRKKKKKCKYAEGEQHKKEELYKIIIYLYETEINK